MKSLRLADAMPVTAESIKAAQEAAARERALVAQEIGTEITDTGIVLNAFRLLLAQQDGQPCR